MRSRFFPKRAIKTYLQRPLSPKSFKLMHGTRNDRFHSFRRCETAVPESQKDIRELSSIVSAVPQCSPQSATRSGNLQGGLAPRMRSSGVFIPGSGGGKTVLRELYEYVFIFPLNSVRKLNTVKSFIFAAPVFCESVTEDLLATTKFRESQTPALKHSRIEIFAALKFCKIFQFAKFPKIQGLRTLRVLQYVYSTSDVNFFATFSGELNCCDGHVTSISPLNIAAKYTDAKGQTTERKNNSKAKKKKKISKKQNY